MAKEPNNLLDKLKASKPIPSNGMKPWHIRLADSDPQLMRQIDDLITAFLNHDKEVRRVASTKTALAQWIKANCNISQKPEAVIRYIDERANGVA